MTYEWNRTCKGVFCFLFFVILWTVAYSTEDRTDTVHLFKNVPRPKLGETCSLEICEENQSCNQENICECKHGFRAYNNDCIPAAGENEACKTHTDCLKNLFCINGICRKSIPNSEFITLAKICLGITVAAIIIAVFSSLIKCLIKYENSMVFQRQNDGSCFNSTLPRQVLSSGSLFNEVTDQKPPSYEECMRSTALTPIASPPPYTITTTPVTTVTEVDPVFQFTNVSISNTQNLTPLNAVSLSNDINSNVIIPQDSQKVHSGEDTSKTSV